MKVLGVGYGGPQEARRCAGAYLQLWRWVPHFWAGTYLVVLPVVYHLDKVCYKIRRFCFWQKEKNLNAFWNVTVTCLQRLARNVLHKTEVGSKFTFWQSPYLILYPFSKILITGTAITLLPTLSSNRKTWKSSQRTHTFFCLVARVHTGFFFQICFTGKSLKKYIDPECLL